MKPKVTEPLSNLLTKAVDYEKYCLASKSVPHDYSMASVNHQMRKKLDCQVETHIFSGQDPIAVLEFLARFAPACNPSNAIETAAMWCHQFSLAGQAHALLQSELA